MMRRWDLAMVEKEMWRVLAYVWDLKEHLPPCVVLVINDNPYGLMFASSYICRPCPQTTLEPYVGFKVVRRCK
jgi:hypothetical protein